MMTASALGDRFGRRRLFTIGLGLFVAASAACAVAPGIGGLIAARAVQGAGAALVAPLALALLSAAFPPERTWARGIFSAVTGLAVLGGPMIGAAITQGISWQWIFWLNVPIGLAVILLARRGVSESFGPNTPLTSRPRTRDRRSTRRRLGPHARQPSGWGSPEVIAVPRRRDATQPTEAAAIHEAPALQATVGTPSRTGSPRQSPSGARAERVESRQALSDAGRRSLLANASHPSRTGSAARRDPRAT